jgi:hypothetical protein
MPGNGEAQACALITLDQMVWALIKFVENALAFLCWDVCTRIRDAEFDPPIPARVMLLGSDRCSDLDEPTCRGKFHRVMQQIVEHLFHPSFVKD